MAEDSSAPPTAEDKARYEALKQATRTALVSKKAVDRQLALIEQDLSMLETAYLTETAAHGGGNVVTGFENYLKNQGAGRRKNDISENDRIFSNSSLTAQKSLALLLEEQEDATAVTQDDIKPTTGGVTTVVLPPATRNQELSVAQQKRIRDKEYQRRKRASVARSNAESEEEIVSAASTSSRRPTKRARMATDDE